MTPALVVPVLGRKLYPGASVALDFTRNLYRSGSPVVKGSPSLLSGFTFARASTGYAETSAGQLVEFASGAPRVTDKGLLVEESGTNYNTYSNALSSGTGLAFTSDVASAPDGTLTAQRISKTDATTPRYTNQNTTSLTVAAATAYTVSRYFKYDGYNTTVSLEYNNTNNFDLSWNAQFTVASTGVTVASVSSCTSGVQALAGGWYRCWATFTSGAAPTGVNPQYLTRITGASGVTVQTFGSSLELGAFPTSYIPTTSASATRQADSATISGLTVASLHTLYSEVTLLRATGVAERWATLSNGSNERTYIGRASSGLAQGFTTAGGVTPSSSAISGAITSGTYKLGVSVGPTTFVAACSGTLGAVRANSPPSGLSLLTIGGEPGLSPANAYIRTAILYPTAFTDAQLQAATAT